uniref:Uncharacterized protein n=1 Tax=Mycobacterium leprae TaxID=1769 RepID=O32931_MYCLR|nr:hypothetical protein MLCB2052.04c [Mycobacterium leprae]
MSLVSMANSGRISKRRILPVSMNRIAAVSTPPQNRGARHARHPHVGNPGSLDQHLTQFTQFNRAGSLHQDLPLPIAPDTCDPTGRPTTRLRPLEKSQPHHGSLRPVARTRAAGKTADSIGGTDSSRHRSHLDHTRGMVGAGNDASRLSSLVR